MVLLADQITFIVESIVIFTFIVITVVTNYHSFRRVSEVTTLMTRLLDVTYPSPAPLLRHHLLVVGGMVMAALFFQAISYVHDVRVGLEFRHVAGWLVLR